MKLVLFLIASLHFGKTLGSCPFSGSKTATGADHSTSGRELAEPAGTPMLHQIPYASDPDDPLVEANDFFKSQYTAAKPEMLPTTNMITSGDYLVMNLANGTRYVEQIIGEYYHNLKMLCHLPIGAYTVLMPNTSQTIALDTHTLAALTDYQAVLNNITLSIDQFAEQDQLQRNQRIYNRTVTFVNALLFSGECSAESMGTFAYSNFDDINANINDAAELQVNATHAAVMHWKDAVLSAAEWQELYVITSVGHMPAQGFSSHIYFDRLFGLRHASGCGEHQGWEFYDNKTFNLGGSSYPDEESYESLVATHFTDGAIGQGFFHSMTRMHMDVLTDGTTQACDKIFGVDGGYIDSGTLADTDDPSDSSGTVGSSDTDELVAYKTATTVLAVLLCMVIGVVSVVWYLNKGHVFSPVPGVHAPAEGKANVTKGPGSGFDQHFELVTTKNVLSSERACDETTEGDSKL